MRLVQHPVIYAILELTLMLLALPAPLPVYRAHLVITLPLDPPIAPFVVQALIQLAVAPQAAPNAPLVSSLDILELRKVRHVLTV